MLDHKSAAIIVWMPEGQAPTIKAYQVSDGEAPETSGYFELGIALIVATKGPPRPGKKPWIKVGTTLIPHERHEALYEAFKNGSELHA